MIFSRLSVYSFAVDVLNRMNMPTEMAALANIILDGVSLVSDCPKRCIFYIHLLNRMYVLYICMSFVPGETESISKIVTILLTFSTK